MRLHFAPSAGAQLCRRVLASRFKVFKHPHGSGATWGSEKIPRERTVRDNLTQIQSGVETLLSLKPMSQLASGTPRPPRRVKDLVVARLWGKLKGAAKSVVRHLDPDAFEGKDGLEKFLPVLRDSPLPVPDSFSRLERWNNLKRYDRETISKLLVREEEHFTELQQALARARMDRSVVGAPPGLKSRPSSPAREPQRGPPSIQRLHEV